MSARDDIVVTKGQLARLLDEISGTDLLEVRLSAYELEGKHGLLAQYVLDNGRQGEDEKVKVLVIGKGVVRL